MFRDVFRGMFGLSKLFGSSVHLPDSTAASAEISRTRLEDIRGAMVSALGERGHDAYPALLRRLRCATDVQGLWYARSDLMAALAKLHGERHAQRQLRSLTNMFQGLLPPGLAAQIDRRRTR